MYTVNLIVKTILNFGGWVIAGIFYGDFCDHVDYMSEYLDATETELLQAEAINCLGNPFYGEEGRCDEVTALLRGEDPNAEAEEDDAEEGSDKEGDDKTADEDEEGSDKEGDDKTADEDEKEVEVSEKEPAASEDDDFGGDDDFFN
jgi:hypothetical protein